MGVVERTRTVACICVFCVCTRRASRFGDYHQSVSREHTDPSHDPIEWRSSSIAQKYVQRYEKSPYFEVGIDFLMLAEVMNGSKSLNVC